MPNRQKIKGALTNVFIGILPIACAKSSTIELMVKTEDTTTKCDVDSNNVLWNSNVATAVGFKVTVSGLSTFDGVSGAPVNSRGRLFAAATTLQPVYVTVVDAQTGEIYGGDCIVVNPKATSGAEATETFDVELLGTGPLATIPVS